MNKHKRPYKCNISNCKVKDFGNAGDLKRHQRAVHGRRTMFCPVVTCKRHTKGFGRKDNWMEHLKRIHSLDSTSTPNTPQKQSFGEQNMQGILTEGSTTGSDDGDSDVEAVEMEGSSTPTEKSSLLAKLHELEALKVAAVAKFDGDIAALKRVLSFM